MKKRFFTNYSFRIIGLSALIISILSSIVSASAQTISDVDATVQRFVESNQIPGGAVAVIRDGKIILTKGYGLADVETKQTANEDTIYEIASITKQFTAAGIMLLVEDGKLKLDETLGKYPVKAPENWQAVTIRQLLNQTSGIKNYSAVETKSDKNYTPEEVLQLVADAPLEFTPGTNWQYSNTNYYLLGLIIEKASGKSYAEFMKERIFNPLNMNSTRVNTSGLKIGRKATGYSTYKEDGWQKISFADPSLPFSAGAIVSTATDMAKWALALEGEKLLKKSSLNEIWTAGKLADGKLTHYGFGWQIGKIGETEFVAHNGRIQGFSSYIIRFPSDNLSVVVLLNSTGRVMEKLGLAVAGLYLPKVATIVSEREKKANETITDNDAATTKFLRETFEKMIAGKVDRNLFTPETQKLLFPDRIAQLKSAFGSQGEIKSFELIADESIDDLRRRTYRISFERLKLRVVFAINAEGKIGGITLRPE